MSFTFSGYTPPVGFGGGTPDLRKKQDQQGQVSAQSNAVYGAPNSAGSVSAQTLPQAPTAGQILYSASYPSGYTAPGGLSFDVPAGSRDGDLMGDASYRAILAQLGVDTDLARAQTTFKENQARNALTGQLSDLGRQSEDQRNHIAAALRARGTGRSSQQEALQAKSYEDQGRGELNLRNMTEDQVAAYESELARTMGDFGRQGTVEAGNAAQRLQAARDAELERAAQAQAAQSWSQSQREQSAALIAAINAQIAGAQSASAGPDITYQPVTPTGGSPDPLRAQLDAMSPEEQAAFRAYIAAQSAPQQQAAPAVAPPPPSAPVRSSAKAATAPRPAAPVDTSRPVPRPYGPY